MRMARPRLQPIPLRLVLPPNQRMRHIHLWEPHAKACAQLPGRRWCVHLNACHFIIPRIDVRRNAHIDPAQKPTLLYNQLLALVRAVRIPLPRVLRRAQPWVTILSVLASVQLQKREPIDDKRCEVTIGAEALEGFQKPSTKLQMRTRLLLVAVGKVFHMNEQPLRVLARHDVRPVIAEMRDEPTTPIRCRLIRWVREEHEHGLRPRRKKRGLAATPVAVHDTMYRRMLL